MAFIRPFRALKYNTENAGDYQNLVSPPYDKINNEIRETLYKNSQYNITHVIENHLSGKERFEYSQSKFDSWRKDGILALSPKPAIYAYTQTYSIEGRTRTRIGISCVIKLEPFSTRTVIPHERTLTGPKEDRLKLLRHTNSHFGQIFFLYEDAKLTVNHLLEDVISNPPIISVKDLEGFTHQVWEITDLHMIQAFARLIASKKLYIADGHHRYETALAYSQEVRKNKPAMPLNAPSDFVLGTLVNMDDTDGLVVLPTHRAVKNLQDFDIDDLFTKLEQDFIVEKIPDINKAYKKLLDASDQGKNAFVVINKDEKNTALITLRSEKCLHYKGFGNTSMDYRRLDVSILQILIFDKLLGIDHITVAKGNHIGYFRGVENIKNKMDEYQIGFVLNPTNLNRMKQVCLNQERMPQKSTDFYPKLLTGLVIYPMD